MSHHDPVAAALGATPRAGHLPAEQVGFAHLDIPLPLFRGLPSSQPSTVSRMLRELDVPRGASVLDVGAGSGWTTALLAHLVGPGGSVLGVELDAELAVWGAARLAATGRPWARLVAADPRVLGAPTLAPFDRILVSAMATDLPTALADQLSDDGVLVAPVADQLWTVRRRGDDLSIRRSGAYRFVPLIPPRP
ncbi:protein-L-isoaspartate O-methyltransferase family protein [Tessaracoccus defluvii]|uniref:Protein-L-isoaspartate O-methyltransferase n=1 Tax=Tessaracoccus defluvii TaxID=1285901 RepID=A0A7H0H6N7_9ACTN|nr:protein-L-isoaspartate carboxylmethyltransferase [Tessaracoccus defluvii]QNP56203.1 protein-L-isoaspartate carboxylmethyltransferase [Tessaracoccus defluvii]